MSLTTETHFVLQCTCVQRTSDSLPVHLLVLLHFLNPNTMPSLEILPQIFICITIRTEFNFEFVTLTDFAVKVLNEFTTYQGSATQLRG